MIIDASVSYRLYEQEERELLRQLEMRRVQLERAGETPAEPSRLQQTLRRLTAAVRGTAGAGSTGSVRSAGRLGAASPRSARRTEPTPCPEAA